jgi:integrase
VAWLAKPLPPAPKRHRSTKAASLSSHGAVVPPLAPGALIETGVLSDGTSTDDSGVAMGGSKREKRLRQNRASYRRREYAAAAAAVLEDGQQFVLETQAVTKRTKKKYLVSLEVCRQWVKAQKMPMRGDAEIDAGLTAYMDAHYFKGFQAHVGETLMSAFIDANPGFAKYGSRRTPRAWRALRAWRRLTPSRSRRPWPLLVWAAIAVTLTLRGFRDMAVFLLLGLGTYARPSELLGIRGKDVIPATRGVSRHGSVLLAPAETGALTKTGESDDSVLLDCAWMPWLDLLVSELPSSVDNLNDHVFTFGYPSFCQEFNAALSELQMSHLGVVPYTWRHSGASIDRAQNRRSLQEVQKRGRWKQPKSVSRYEKAGRLGLVVRELTSEQRAYCELAERHLGDFISGRRTPLHRFRNAA